MKIPDFKWSRIGYIAEFHGIPNGFPNLAVGTPPLPPPPSAGVEVDACYTNANSSPATSSQIERRKKSGTKIQHGLR
jgi:hypothetical protein